MNYFTCKSMLNVYQSSQVLSSFRRAANNFTAIQNSRLADRSHWYLRVPVVEKKTSTKNAAWTEVHGTMQCSHFYWSILKMHFF